MNRLLSLLFVLGLSAALPASHAAPAAAEAVNPVEARLRDSLRATTVQLRDAQNQVATLQAAQADSEQKIKEQAAQVSALIKQGASDRDSAQKSLAEAKTLAARQAEDIERLKTDLAAWKTSRQQIAEIAETKEAERAKLEARGIELDRQVADQQLKNTAAIKLGLEILARYEKFGLGEALTAREPFVGITRVKLQNLVEDFQEKLLDQKITP
jgi:predicted RNase H-like nuclease (RuvC/YqgF family)